MATETEQIKDKQINIVIPTVGTFAESMAAIEKSSLTPAARALAMATLSSGQVTMHDFGDGPDPVLDVTRFYNHGVNVRLMNVLGHELATKLKPGKPGSLVTVATSGVYPTQFIAQRMNLDFLVVKKGSPPITFDNPHTVHSRSYTGVTPIVLSISEECVDRSVSPNWAFVDDFLDGGKTTVAAMQLMDEVGINIDQYAYPYVKCFAGGLDRLVDERKIPRGNIHSVLNLLELTPEHMTVEGVNKRLKFADRPAMLSRGGNVWQNRPGN